MKQVIIMMIALFTTLGINAQAKKQTTTKKQTTSTKVYITKAKGAKAYHKAKTCKYLSKCNDVQAISKSQAQKLGRTTCSACYPNTKKATSKAQANKNVNTNNNKNAANANKGNNVQTNNKNTGSKNTPNNNNNMGGQRK